MLILSTTYRNLDPSGHEFLDEEGLPAVLGHDAPDVVSAVTVHATRIGAGHGTYSVREVLGTWLNQVVPSLEIQRASLTLVSIPSSK